MPLDGLRAWIGEVERKLGMRTRVFLVLATIAIGGAGAAIYLALDTRDDAVSESDVRALQQELEGQLATGGTTGGIELTQLEAELDALRSEVEELRGGNEAGQGNGGADDSGGISPDAGANSDGTSSDTVPEGPGADASAGSATNAPSGSNAPSDAVPDDASKGRLGDLIEEAKRQSEKADEAQGSDEDR
jgi:hypothetical protein